jgi:hypothetical protein
MNLLDFSLQHDFLTPMIFRASVAAELATRALAQSRSDILAIPKLPFGVRDALSAQAPLAKIVIFARNSSRFIMLRRGT